MTLLPLLLAAAAANAGAQEFRLPVDAAALVAGARALAARPQAPVRPAAFRVLPFRATGQAAPLNRGFQALGPAGATGQVKAGPFGVGNGSYRVAANDPDQLLLDVRTNYIDGRFILTRDAATGRDSLGFKGRLKDPSRGDWNDIDSLKDGTVTYDPSSDSGLIGWNLRGQRQQDSYRGGAAGGDMVISLSGHDHEFIRD